MSTRIVVTGIGIVSPLGISKQGFWQGLINGKSGIRRIRRWDASAYPCQIAGEVDDVVFEGYLSAREAKRNSRFVNLARVATSLVIRDASIDPEQLTQPGTGVVLGTAVGPVAAIEEQVCVALAHGISRVSPLLPFTGISHSAASSVCIELGITGPAHTIATGCVGGIDAIGFALKELRSGALDVAIVGAAEAPICPVALASLCNTGMLSVLNSSPETASRPFDRRHNGFVLSEGAALVTLESYQKAVDRGAHIYGEIIGYGSSSDAYHPFDVDPQGAGFARAMQDALESAGIGPEKVDYINAHAPAIDATDRAEAKAIKQVLGQRSRTVPVSSIKGHLGQAFAAANLQQVIASLLALETQIVPPTANYEEPDPECAVNCSSQPRAQSIDTVLINAHTLGGSNSSLVISKTTS